VWYTTLLKRAKCDAFNRTLAVSAVKRWGNVWEFHIIIIIKHFYSGLNTIAMTTVLEGTW